MATFPIVFCPNTSASMPLKHGDCYPFATGRVATAWDLWVVQGSSRRLRPTKRGLGWEKLGDRGTPIHSLKNRWGQPRVGSIPSLGTRYPPRKRRPQSLATLGPFASLLPVCYRWLSGESLFQSEGGLFLHPWEDMAVEVQGDANRRVSEDVAHHLGMLAVRQG